MASLSEAHGCFEYHRGHVEHELAVRASTSVASLVDSCAATAEAHGSASDGLCRVSGRR